MAPKSNLYQLDLEPLLQTALLQNQPGELEAYLTGHSGLPGPRLNLALVSAFAEVVGSLVIQPAPLVQPLENLLDGWAALPVSEAASNQPQEILPGVAVRAYGRVAVMRPDWWEDEIGKLHRATSDPRWRVRELVAIALQDMLLADWPRTYRALAGWLTQADPLVIRAVVGATAEPSLLKDPLRAGQALAIQAQAVEWLIGLPAKRRQEEPFRILRQALGYGLSVVVAAAPQAGLELIEQLAERSDPDIRWILRQNLKKARLNPWSERLNQIEKRLNND